MCVCVVTVCEGGGERKWYVMERGGKRKEQRGRRGNKGLGGNDSSHSSHSHKVH